MKRLVAIGFIWLGCAVAWVILGSNIVHRTGTFSSSLAGEVHALWGPPLAQLPPSVSYLVPAVIVEERLVDEKGIERVHQVVKKQAETVAVPLAATRIEAALDLEHRRKGLMWFPTYAVAFDGRFETVNRTDSQRVLDVRFPLASAKALYDGFEVTTTGSAGETAPVDVRLENGAAVWSHPVGPGERVRFGVRYRSRGTETWSYDPSDAGRGRVDQFDLVLDTNFREVDFPPGALSPTTHRTTSEGWRGEWRFETLVGSAPVGLVFPERLNPGPLASRITFFAPVSLLFFFFVVAILAVARGRTIHPMNYFFFGCAFFAFHLLFAYLVDHLAVVPSLALASAASVVLVVSYARLFVGWRFALLEIGVSQLLYLVFFTVTFMWEGFTGLSITVGAVLTLFVMMQITGRVDWSRATPQLTPEPGEKL